LLHCLTLISQANPPGSFAALPGFLAAISKRFVALFLR
jgi:hypothetical protein